MENLRLDYETTVQQFTTLADIRFKLLAFVPTVTGAAFGILKNSPNNPATAAIGVFGFLVTLGIIFYEIRNTQFYDGAVHRAKALEARLKLPICAAGFTVGGFFSERSKGKLRLFGLVKIWHDMGLAIVYGSTLAAWTLLVLHAVLASKTGERFFAMLTGQLDIVSAVVAGVIGFVFGWQMIRLSKMDKPAPVLEDIAALEDLTRCMGEAERNCNDKFFETSLANNLTFRRANGAIVDKETFLNDLQNPANTYETLEQRDIAAQVYEGVGVVILLVQAKGMREGKAFEGLYRNIRIFLKEPNLTPGWQLHSWFNVKVP